MRGEGLINFRVLDLEILLLIFNARTHVELRFVHLELILFSNSVSCHNHGMWIVLIVIQLRDYHMLAWHLFMATA